MKSMIQKSAAILAVLLYAGLTSAQAETRLYGVITPKKAADEGARWKVLALDGTEQSPWLESGESVVGLSIDTDYRIAVSIPSSSDCEPPEERTFTMEASFQYENVVFDCD